MNSVQKLAYGVGTAWFKKEPSDIDRKIVEGIKTAISVGYRHIDNAQVYRNEEECGIALKEANFPREQLWITTKLLPGKDVDAVEALRTSLKKLQLDQVELYLIHFPFFDWKGEGNLEETWRALERCKTLGLTKHIGVSNFRVEELDRIRAVAKEPIFANQVENHPYNAQRALHGYMKQHGILGESYAPLAPLVHKTDGPLDGPLQEIAGRYGRTEGQILLRWNLQKGNVVVTTSGKIERMKEQLQIFDFELSQEDVAEIDRLGDTLHFRKYFQKELDGEASS